MENKDNPLKYAPNFRTSYSNDEVQNMLDSSPGWYHHFKFNNIETVPTKTSLEYQMWCAQGIPLNLDGKSVLDIGAYDGFYSFLCEQRGANRVLAIDNEEHDENVEKIQYSSTNFEISKKLLNSNVEYKKMDVYDIRNLNESFDVILMFGVYYHLENVILALQNIFSKVNDVLYLSGHILETNEPLLYYYDTSSYDPDGWSRIMASSQCLINMGKTIGFKNVELLDTKNLGKTKKYPHMIDSNPRDMVGTFKFSK